MINNLNKDTFKRFSLDDNQMPIDRDFKNTDNVDCLL